MSADIYDFAGTMGDGSMAIALMGVLLVVYLVMIAYSVLVYVLGSLGMYTIAKRRGIHHPWMAWVPVVNMWILGSLSDQYQYVAKGKVRNRRKVLIGLTIAIYALLLLIIIMAFVFGFSAALGNGDFTGGMFVPLLLLVLCYVAMLVVSIVLTVFQYIAYYDLFTSCNPDNAVAFLVLSIFFNFLLPFFVFACRKKDLGMPPRKQQVPTPPQSEWQEPAEEPAQELPQQIIAEDPVNEGFAEEEDFAEEAEETAEE